MRHASALAALLLIASVSSARAQNTGPTLDVRGFTDFNYIDSQQSGPQGFRAGQLVGHVVASLSDRVAFFSEVSATPQASGFTVEAERFILRYDYSDLLKLSAGRHHTPISYWNTAYHHGTWLQTSEARPGMLRGAFLPVHFVGLQAEGAVTPGPVSLGYAVGVGNGRSSNIMRSGDAGDVNNNRAFAASTFLQMPHAAGIQVGASYYADRVSPSSTLDVDERIVLAHLVREKETPEVIIEYARVTHDPRKLALPTTHNDGYYGQLGYRLPGQLSKFKPYMRYERMRVPSADTLFAALHLGSEGVLGGVRYDVAPVAALKLEYRVERFEARQRFRTLAAQLSFSFPGAGPGAPAEPVAADPDGGAQEQSHTAPHH